MVQSHLNIIIIVKIHFSLMYLILNTLGFHILNKKKTQGSHSRDFFGNYIQKIIEFALPSVLTHSCQTEVLACSLIATTDQTVGGQGVEVSVGMELPRRGAGEFDLTSSSKCTCVCVCVPSAGWSSSCGWSARGRSRAGSEPDGRSGEELRSETGAHSPQTRSSTWGYL